MNDGTQPATGSYDLRFAVFDAANSGTQVSGVITNSAQPVTNGLFTVALDFGAGVFPGANRWLELGVRTNGGAGFFTLTPRQPVTASPYAITAGNVTGLVGAGQISGTVGLGQLPGALVTNNAATVVLGGSFSGGGSGLTNVNASAFNGLGASNFWQLKGNNVGSGQFLGSTNNQPLEIWAGNQRAVRLEPSSQGAPNTIEGSAANFVLGGVVGASIGGGGATNYGGAKYTNSVADDFGTVAGGASNTASSFGAFVGGGRNNLAGGNFAVTAGGQNNTATQIGASVGGGFFNTATNTRATVPGGEFNVAGGVDSFAAGQNAQALHAGTFVWADTQFGAFPSTASNQFNVRASGGVRLVTKGAGLTVDGIPVVTNFVFYGLTIQSNTNNAPNLIGGSSANVVAPGVQGATIGGGGGSGLYYDPYYGGYYNLVSSNLIQGGFATIAGGNLNKASGLGSTISGGIWNSATNVYSTVGGGYYNFANGYGSTVGGGVGFLYGNRANGAYSTVGGGCDNAANARFSTVSGGYNNYTGTNDSTTIGGGYFNSAQGTNATIAGGFFNNAFAYNATIGGGSVNTAMGPATTIAGGTNNQALANGATVGGGGGNIAGNTNENDQSYDTVSGGFHNSALNGFNDYYFYSGGYNFVGGGYGNTAGSTNLSDYGYNTVAGGSENKASGGWSTIGGGWLNKASGRLSTIGGGGASSYGETEPNVASGMAATIGGGTDNSASTNYATIPGGFHNTASGMYSFAAGANAAARHDGAFVWADASSTYQPFGSSGANQFLIRAMGGTGIGVTNPAYIADIGGRIRLRNDANTAGLWLYNSAAASDRAFFGMAGDGIGLVGLWGNQGAGFRFVMNVTNGFVGIGSGVNPTNRLQVLNAYCDGTTWVNASDRNLKESFSEINPQEVLARVMAMPIQTWSYKTQPSEKHLGPVAQDFHAAFGLGQNDTTISTVDEGGVALAAIQGLNQKMDEKEALLKSQTSEIQALRQQNNTLAARLQELETLVKTLVDNK